MDRAVALIVLAACGGEVEPEPAPYATEVVSFSPGEGAGFGQERLPGVVLGPPLGEGTSAASLDVLSLGASGEIVVGFDRIITDGEGPDFAVFENPFFIRGDPSDPYAELGEVSTSTDAITWRKFTCNRDGEGDGRWPGCAGWTPTSLGGDAFDLHTVGLTEAKYVRLVDLDGGGEIPSVGFDLDAVGLINYR